LADNWFPAARLSCVSGERASSRGKDDTLFAKITGKIVFKDRGQLGKYVMIEPIAAE
jgi:ribosomal protein L27